MTDITKISDLTAKQIGKLMRKAFAELLKRISDGQDARDAISAIMQGFEPAYRETLAKSFTKALDTFVGPDELVSYPVGEVSLSQVLYRHARETSAAVQRLVFEHAAGWHDARKLALDIYEGYGFKGGDDPLQWPKDSPKWPKYMRLAVVTDPASYRGWLNAAKQAAGEIKTPALQAAYSELLDAVEKGAGQKALAKKLDVAFQEQMRYRANRIAQTELHRQWMDRQAEDIMGDETISVVQVKLADSHPKTDICDLFANQDKFGLGPGLYPKEKAPKPPFHPWCRCRWVSKRLLSADKAKENPSAERAFLRDIAHQDGVSKAARVIGSKNKLLRVLNGKSTVEEVFNQYRPAPYKLGRMGDAPLSGQRAILKEVKTAYDIALDGGRHHGLLSRNEETRTPEIEKSIRSLRKQIAIHEDKASNPRDYLPDNVGELEISYLVKKTWPKEIRRFNEEIEVLIGILNKRSAT